MGSEMCIRDSVCTHLVTIGDVELYVALQEVTWRMVVWCTQNLRRDGSSFMWHQPCQRSKYTTLVDIQKHTIKASHSCRITCELSESARERRIALYKSNHHHQRHVLGCRADILGTNCDQCLSTVQCCFTSTETVRLIRTGSPGRPPRLSHSS